MAMPMAAPEKELSKIERPAEKEPRKIDIRAVGAEVKGFKGDLLRAEKSKKQGEKFNDDRQKELTKDGDAKVVNLLLEGRKIGLKIVMEELKATHILMEVYADLRDDPARQGKRQIYQKGFEEQRIKEDNIAKEIERIGLEVSELEKQLAEQKEGEPEKSTETAGEAPLKNENYRQGPDGRVRIDLNEMGIDVDRMQAANREVYDPKPKPQSRLQRITGGVKSAATAFGKGAKKALWPFGTGR